MDRLKVLIIHQNSEIKKGIFNILSNFDLDFIYASDGLDGLAAAKYDSPDLIFCGVNLPVLDGLSLGRMVKNDEVTKSIPLVFLHDGLDFHCLQEARTIDAKAFLMYPYLDNSLIYAMIRSFKKPVTRIHGVMTSYEQTLHSRTPIHIPLR